MFGDIGIGIILSTILTHLFGVELNAIYVIAGILFALIPDIDMLSYVHPWFKKIFNDHRDWTHEPWLYLVISITLYFIAGPLWALLFFSTTLLHFIHDSLWIGPGIMWFTPISKKRYKFFNIEKPYEPGPITWFRDFYLRPTIVSITEISVFFLSLIILYTFLN
ncbi:MAG: metal-dependent hydrolase [bacterium]|nr:metal-dependent hydrolase [bacterium]